MFRSKQAFKCSECSHFPRILTRHRKPREMLPRPIHVRALLRMFSSSLPFPHWPRRMLSARVPYGAAVRQPPLLPFVVVGHRPGPAFLHRQTALGAVERPHRIRTAGSHPRPSPASGRSSGLLPRAAARTPWPVASLASSGIKPLSFGLGLFMFEVRRTGPREDRGELRPGIGRAHFDDAHRLDPWLWRLDSE
jgi:hypothetical protein